MHADEVHDRSHHNAPENNRVVEKRPDHLLEGDMEGDFLLEASTTDDAPSVPGEVVTPINDNPGKTLGVVAFVFSLTMLYIVGFVLSIVAMSKSSKADHKNGFALAALLISIFQLIATAVIVGLFGYLRYKLGY